ncbi:hypothetical protein DPMN_169007 [Dreissena polymorpha]|uniref:Uncharacterized protein n=1 Tax=Dreissena polymorpha TaxID=45954 RepID=A0A9D4F6L6_DREPO|nr:hypothetical protein DPMN_169007 [Dreissena polymorpha]
MLHLKLVSYPSQLCICLHRYFCAFVTSPHVNVSQQSGMGTITWLAWKGDFIVFADADGQICLWDLKAKQAR